MNINDLKQVRVIGAPGFCDHTGWLHTYFDGFNGARKAVVTALWEDGYETHVFSAEYIHEQCAPCPYTHAHTRHWCGYATCRDS